MRAAIIAGVVPVLLLAGCGRADIAACEDFVKEGLKAPSTYKRISVNTYDEPVSLPEFIKKTGQENAHPVTKQLLALQAERGLALRTVAIVSEAHNSYGVPLRTTEICAFKLVGGKLEGKSSIASSVARAKLRRSSNMMAEAGLLPKREQQGPYPCCL